MAKRRKDKLRSALSGRIINNGREVIATDEAVDYVKKMGFILIKNTDKSVNKFLREIENFVGFIFLALISILIIPSVSAAPPSQLYTLDLTQWEGRIISILVFAIAGVMFARENFIFAGTLILIMGILFAFNSVNLIISLLIMAVGIFILTQDGRE